MSSWQRGNASHHRKQTTPRNNTTSAVSRDAQSAPSAAMDPSTFDKLLTYLTKSHPEYPMSDFTEAIHTYRQQQQTLAGIPLNRLEEDLIQIIRRKYPNIETATSNASAGKSYPDEAEQSVTALLWSTFKRYREREQSTRPSTKIKNPNPTVMATAASGKEENECRICLEDLMTHKTESFPCQHEFHRRCLEEWFKIERTCPLCRKMLLLDDEFPDLK